MTLVQFMLLSVGIAGLLVGAVFAFIWYDVCENDWDKD